MWLGVEFGGDVMDEKREAINGKKSYNELIDRRFFDDSFLRWCPTL